MAFRVLALAVPDPVKTEIKIAYPERNIMECTLGVIVFGVNAGKVINTRRDVVGVVSLMLSKSLISFVHPEASWSYRVRFPGFFTFFCGVYFLLMGNTKASDLKVCLLYTSPSPRDA